MNKIYLLISFLLVCGCTSLPEGIEPVKDFDLGKYMGKWYEIARLDHSFERGLTHVTAEYRLMDDGSVQVINSGYSADDNEFSSIEGKAYLVRGKREGYLKVSFFGPFYSSYVVFNLGENYEYSMVTSSDRSYLWLLSRTQTVNDSVIELFIKESRELGFDTEKLIFVDQNLIK